MPAAIVSLSDLATVHVAALCYLLRPGYLGESAGFNACPSPTLPLNIVTYRPALTHVYHPTAQLSAHLFAFRRALGPPP